MPRLSILEHKYILIYMNTSSLFLRRCLSLALSLAVGSVVAAEASPSELPTRVVQPREVALTLPAEGVVEALSQAVVAAQVAGRVTEMRVDAGQAVKKGEVIVRIDAGQAIELDSALNRLAELDPRAARIVELHFFAGLGLERIAELLGVSDRTVNRDWRVARAWLQSELAD